MKVIKALFAMTLLPINLRGMHLSGCPSYSYLCKFKAKKNRDCFRFECRTPRQGKQFKFVCHVARNLNCFTAIFLL